MGYLVELNNVDVAFELATANNQKGLRSFLRPKEKKFKKGLNDVSLIVQEGERVGIVGDNGAGKTTFLRTVAGIYMPTSGDITVTGRVTPLFELATGFEMDQTGIENIYIRSLLLGISKNEIQHKVEEICDFSGLGEWLHQPVKTYSAGMFLKLAFSISTAYDPEILLLDEVVGAGDIKFREKAADRMDEYIKKGKIVMITSHDMNIIQRYCNRCIWIKNGSVFMDGAVDIVTEAYSNG